MNNLSFFLNGCLINGEYPVQVLNGQQVLRDERKGAEIDYLKRFGTTWLALKTEDERKKFNAIHPRYMQLVASKCYILL